MNNSRRANSCCRLGMGWIALISLSTNIYAILMFHRMEAAGQNVNLRFAPGGESETRHRDGKAPPSRNRSATIDKQQRDDGGGAPQGRKNTLRKNRQTPREETPSPWPKPDGWEKYGFYKTRHHFKCKVHAHDQTKPLPSLEDWKLIRDTYKEFVDNIATTFDEPVPPTMGYTLGKEGPAPFYAALSDGRGRGLFASRDIKKGELVHDGNQSDFSFPDGMAWRRFIFSLPRKKACDVIDWSWTQQTEKNGKYKIFSAMNISVLLNGGDETVYNLNPTSKTSSKMYATRDINKDEELLTDYDIYDTVWDEVGLGSADDEDKDDGGDDNDEDDYDDDDDQQSLRSGDQDMQQHDDSGEAPQETNAIRQNQRKSRSEDQDHMQHRDDGGGRSAQG
mmetsp:Transcript_26426/g.48625  ORF Transcript_26426/g.48625 Transcript_26426/m.48625 type:complete len:392 (+) Transcript_26426:53-1228(+)